MTTPASFSILPKRSLGLGLLARRGSLRRALGLWAWTCGLGAASLPAQAEPTPQAAPTTFAIRGAYLMERSSQGPCTSGTPRDIVGYLPGGEGRHPVFVYLTGTTMKFNGPEAQKITLEMAKRGFVAAAVDYDNASYPYCAGMEEKARCIFDEKSERSALAKLCAHEKADCSLGVVVSGFSQGANLSALSRNYHGQVQAAYLLGHGNRPNHLLNMSQCADDPATKLAPSQMRSVNGEHDGFFGLKLDGVRKQLERVVGVSCPNGQHCLQPDGSGWVIVRDAELKDGAADHCYFFDGADPFCAKYKGLDAGWAEGDHPWSLRPNLDWLAAQVRKDGEKATATAPAAAPEESPKATRKAARERSVASK